MQITFLPLETWSMTALMKVNLKMCSIGKKYTFISVATKKAIIFMHQTKKYSITTGIVLSDQHSIMIKWVKLRIKVKITWRNTLNLLCKWEKKYLGMKSLWVTCMTDGASIYCNSGQAATLESELWTRSFLTWMIDYILLAFENCVLCLFYLTNELEDLWLGAVQILP